MNGMKKFVYKRDAVISILFLLVIVCVFFFIHGIKGGLIVLFCTIIYVSITNNCYCIKMSATRMEIKLIFGEKKVLLESFIFTSDNIKTIQLGDPLEEDLRYLGYSRYIHIYDYCYNRTSLNVERVASEKFEIELTKFCQNNNIPLYANMKDYNLNR